jgi:hypothetical protein
VFLPVHGDPLDWVQEFVVLLFLLLPLVLIDGDLLVLDVVLLFFVFE